MPFRTTMSIVFHTNDVDEAQATIDAVSADVPEAWRDSTLSTIEYEQTVPTPPSPTPPTQGAMLDSLDPVSAKVGDPDVTLHCRGSGFTENSVVVFNNGDETTTFVSETELTTIVKTSGVDFAVTPGGYPVYVREAMVASEVRTFTIEPAA